MSAPKLIAQQEIARMVHDLKTPLAAMQTATDLISNDPLTATQQHHLKTLQDEILNLRELAATILQTHQLGGAEQDTSTQLNSASPEKSIHEQLLHIVDLYAPQAKHSGLHFVHRWSQDAMSAYTTTADVLQRILAVLIDNAIQYTQAGTITLSAHIKYLHHKPHLMVDLTDTGPGLTSEQASLLDEPSSNTSKHGNGIGLWSTRSLARSLDGDVQLVKNTEHGACFEVLLPLQDFAVQPRSKPHPSEKQGQRTPLKGSVLVVDDNEPNRQLLGAVFTSFGLELREAASGREALRMQQQDPADLVFLDLNMPELNGSETLQRLKQEPLQKAKAYFAITADVPPEQRPQLLKDGFTQILEKPINPSALYSMLESALHP